MSKANTRNLYLALLLMTASGEGLGATHMTPARCLELVWLRSSDVSGTMYRSVICAGGNYTEISRVI